MLDKTFTSIELAIENSAAGSRASFKVQPDRNFVLYRTDGFAICSYLMNGAAGQPFAFNVPVSIQGNTAWHAGNDGSGSAVSEQIQRGTSRDQGMR